MDVYGRIKNYLDDQKDIAYAIAAVTQPEFAEKYRTAWAFAPLPFCLPIRAAGFLAGIENRPYTILIMWQKRLTVIVTLFFLYRIIKRGKNLLTML